MKKSYVISVSIAPRCYRHIRISQDDTLLDLSEAILDAFDFINDHAHAFFMDNDVWGDGDCYYADFVDEDEEYRHTCDFALHEVGLVEKKKFVYVFDFGDDWEFQCRVLKVEEKSVNEPTVLRSVGEAPLQYEMNEEGR